MGKRISSIFIAVSLIILFLGSEATAGSKVQLCHVPPGKLDAWHTITVGEKAVPAHLAHGDLVGACNDLCTVLCDDNNACTIDDTGDCESQGCPVEPRAQVNCNDDNQCTEDTCNPDTGMCMNLITLGAECDLCEPRPCNLLYGECDAEGECILTRVCLEDEDIVVSSTVFFDDDVTFYAGNNFTISVNTTVLSLDGYEIDIIAGGSFTMETGAALDSAGLINIDADGSATIDGTIAGADDVTLIIGGDVTIMGFGIVSTSGSIVINAGNNVTIDSFTDVTSASETVDINAGDSFILEAGASLNSVGAIGIGVGTTAVIAGDLYAERVEIQGSLLDNIFTIKPGYTTIVDVFGGGGLLDTLNYDGDGCVVFSTPTSGTIRSNVGSADINFTDIVNVMGTSGPCVPAP